MGRRNKNCGHRKLRYVQLAVSTGAGEAPGGAPAQSGGSGKAPGWAGLCGAGRSQSARRSQTRQTPWERGRWRQVFGVIAHGQ